LYKTDAVYARGGEFKQRNGKIIDLPAGVCYNNIMSTHGRQMKEKKGRFRMKRTWTIVLAAILLLSLSACSGSADGGNDGDTVMVEIVMENGGVIRLELYPDVAPITVAHFTELADSGFYDGLIFHRVIEGFMIQGGDPTGTGFGDPSQETIKGEFLANGVKNDLSHERGVISMARKSRPYDSATSQFFIMHRNKPSLDGQYAAFGRVVSGMEVVDAIAETPTDASDRPLTPQVIKSIRTVPQA
jgi:peptidyl-prolyl cis-trans isomerase B (cyclophilin B)